MLRMGQVPVLHTSLSHHLESPFKFYFYLCRWLMPLWSPIIHTPQLILRCKNDNNWDYDEFLKQKLYHFPGWCSNLLLESSSIIPYVEWLSPEVDFRDKSRGGLQSWAQMWTLEQSFLSYWQRKWEGCELFWTSCHSFRIHIPHNYNSSLPN